jgi:TolB protein
MARGPVSLVVSIATTVLLSACGGPTPSASLAPSAAASTSAAPITTAPPSTSSSPRPIGSTGSIGLLSQDGSLSVVDASGRTVYGSDPANGNFGFPTWSPDGSRLAAPRTKGADKSIVVFGARDLANGLAEPTVIFESATIDPFYLFWTPDGQAVSFLASDAGDLSLRIATADGRASPSGGGPASLVRKGNPFYYDWIGRDRLLAHIGIGPEAFLGEIGLDGKAAGRALGHPGDFRSAVVSRDGKSVAYVRDGGTSPAEIVVAARDGSSEHAMEVFGTAAVIFDPTGDTLAAIGPVEPQPPAGFPIGPVRLIDVASGKVRTLIDGAVASFWWSPDGRTIAALRVQEVAGSGRPTPAASSAAPESAAPETEVRLLFVDVATAKTRSQPVVHLGANFVNGVIAYFDQYALSHRVWAPDSSSILLPEADDDGSAHVTVRYPDGEPSIELDGELGFWSP